MKIKSYIRELENGYASAPFCTYNTVFSQARRVVRYTIHSAERKSRPVWLLTRIPEIEKEKELLFFNSTKLWILWIFFFVWLINKLEQQLDFAIPAHYTSRSHPKRYFLHLLVFLLIYSNVRPGGSRKGSRYTGKPRARLASLENGCRGGALLRVPCSIPCAFLFLRGCRNADSREER